MSKLSAETNTLVPTTASGFSWVWLVPLVVSAIAAWTVYQSYADRGVSVEIRFAQGKGIEAGKTEIRYKDVVIGTVKSLDLSEDLQGVVATALLDRKVEAYLGDTTDFWIVTAEISGTSFRGLNTLLSGAYIEVDWSGKADKPSRDFIGRLEPPLTPPSTGGRHFALDSAEAGSVAVGSPVMYRGLQVGQIERRGLSEDYQRIEFEVFVEAPYDSLINGSTRFFDVSGISVSIAGDGVSLQIGSLQTLATGGISFYTPIGAQISNDSADPRAGHKSYSLFKSRNAAEESFFETSSAEHYFFSAVFDGGVEGLERGAPVMWQGIRFGTVSDIRLNLENGPQQDSLLVILDLQPARIGFAADNDEDAIEDMADWVNAGLRVEVVSSNLLTGKKRLNLVERPDGEPAELERDALPFPRLPTVSSPAGEMSKNISDITASLASIPYEELAASATRLMANAALLLGSADTQALPGTLTQSLDAFARLSEQLGGAASEGEAALGGLAPDSALYQELSQTIRELRNASRSVTALTTLLEENPNALLTGRQ